MRWLAYVLIRFLGQQIKGSLFCLLVNLFEGDIKVGSNLSAFLIARGDVFDHPIMIHVINISLN